MHFLPFFEKLLLFNFYITVSWFPILVSQKDKVIFLILQNNLWFYYKHSQKTKQLGINLSKI